MFFAKGNKNQLNRLHVLTSNKYLFNFAMHVQSNVLLSILKLIIGFYLNYINVICRILPALLNEYSLANVYHHEKLNKLMNRND